MNPDVTPPDSQPTTAVPLLAGRYQLLDKLGEGGMGAVFQARDTKLDRFVAIKLLPDGSIHDAEAVARFQREARALAKLSHPGIIQAYDNGQDGNKHFLVMELVTGNSLAAELRDKGRLSPTYAADCAHQAALALHHAHRNGLIHRDVKPSNLLLAADGRVKLLDLGLARFLQDQVGDSTLTRLGSGLGTPDYVPPEQYRDAHRADPRSDIYSLGCTLYHLMAGRVPFPGSSMSEKMEAHERKEPTPLPELCPEMPGGLALVVERMMAKRPADRFQSMAEVADALAPYVAGSSASFRQIRNSSTWDGSRLATVTALSRRRVVPLWVAAAAVVVVLVAAGLVGLAAWWFRPGGEQVAQIDGALPGATGKETPRADTGKSKPPDVPPPSEQPTKLADEPDILTVSQKPGAAKYQTIGAALAAVTAGQTIRVLDDAVYRESLRITGRTERAGITLEAVGGATLALDKAGERSVLVEIGGVPDVTVRGFHLRATQTPRSALIGIIGDSPGLRLDRLELTASGSLGTSGIEYHAAGSVAPARQPVVIRDCTFHGFALGAELNGGKPGATVFRTAVQDCLFTDCLFGVQIVGSAQEVQVVGNRFRGTGMAAVQFLTLSEDVDSLLVANNTIYEGATAFRLWGTIIGKHVQVRNNLVLGGEGMDMFVVDAINAKEDRGPGDGAAVAQAYRFSHNWREGKEWGPGKGWIPPDPRKGDVLAAKIDGVNRDSKSPDFLRPDPKSPLATAGAGNEDPSVPRYVGALPPEGTDPWDWERAGRMPKDAQLLTVSKDSKDGGKYRTISDALKDARPWATIRVLDGAAYEEAILIGSESQHEGLTLEAVAGATVVLPPSALVGLMVRGVSHVTVRGFRVRTEKSQRTEVYLAAILGACQGVVLDRLDVRSGTVSQAIGVTIEGINGPAGAAPIVVRDCTFSGLLAGVRVSGLDSNVQRNPKPSRGVEVRHNRVFDCATGVWAAGKVKDVQIVGNTIWSCGDEAVHLFAILPGTEGVLIANNTLRGHRRCLYVNEPQAGSAGVEIRNNLLLADEGPDMAYTDKDREALQTWTIAGNWHQGRAPAADDPEARGWIVSTADHWAERIELKSRDAKDGDYLRPPSASPLARAGGGRGLPEYVGAVPPEGNVAWDWDRTWRARVKKTDARK